MIVFNKKKRKKKERGIRMAGGEVGRAEEKEK